MSTIHIVIVTLIVCLLALSAFFVSMRFVGAHAGFCAPRCAGVHGKRFFGKLRWDEADKIQYAKQLCRERGRQKIVNALKSVEVQMDFSDAQLAKWIDVSNAVQAELNTVNFLCDKVFTQDNHASTPARLELMETAMVTALEAIQRVRPPLLELYQTLSAEQQRQLDDLLPQRRHRFKW